MTEPREPTAKQWKRRALQAEQQVEFLQGVRAREADNEMRQFRELAALRVALKEANEIINWALDSSPDHTTQSPQHAGYFFSAPHE